LIRANSNDTSSLNKEIGEKNILIIMNNKNIFQRKWRKEIYILIVTTRDKLLTKIQNKVNKNIRSINVNVTTTKNSRKPNKGNNRENT